MNFKEALAHIVGNDNPQHYCNAFYLYSRLSDICRSSYTDKQKILLFFDIDKRFGIVKNIHDQGRLAVAVLKAAYPAVKDELSLNSYKAIIDLVADIMLPQPGGTPQNKTKVQVAKPQSAAVKAQAVKPANAVKKAKLPSPAPKPKQQPKPKPKANKKPYTPPRTVSFARLWKVIAKWSVISLAVAAVIAGAACMIAFRKSISWTGWQYIIGAGAGGVLFGIGAFVSWKIDDEFLLPAYVPALFIVLVLAVGNGALFFLCGGAYRVIFIFISAYAVLGGVIAAYLAFDDIEDGWGAAIVAEIVAIVAALIVELILL